MAAGGRQLGDDEKMTVDLIDGHFGQRSDAVCWISTRSIGMISAKSADHSAEPMTSANRIYRGQRAACAADRGGGRAQALLIDAQALLIEQHLDGRPLASQTNRITTGA